MRKKLWIFTTIFGVAVFSGVLLRNYSNRLDETVARKPIFPLPPIEITPEPTPTPLIYDETPPAKLTGFFEKQPIISTQQGYVAYPLVVDIENPPSIVVYYHGSTQKITKNFSEDVMKNMRKYGDYFANRNFVFVASNQHGDNWGKKIAVDDSMALVKWVTDRYPITNDIYVLGFSMGGQPAMKHVIVHPKDVRKIALLAPANQVEYYTATQIKYFRQVPLEIWHGTADVNVPYWATKLLVKEFGKQKTPVVVHTLDGKTHWDVDTEYMEDVYDFFVK